MKPIVIFLSIIIAFLRFDNSANAQIKYDLLIWDIAVAGDKLFVVSGNGTYQVTDKGSTFTSVGYGDCDKLAASGSSILTKSRSYNGLSLSQDFGKTWKAIENEPKDIYDIAVIDNTVFASNKRGLFVTHDFGQKWNKIKQFSFAYLTKPVDTKSIYVASDDNALYKSNDAGLNWEAISTNFSSMLNCIVKSGTTLYAGTFSGIGISEDQGKTWSAASLKSQVQTLVVAGSNICAGLATYSTDKGMSISHDNGKTFTVVESLKGKEIGAMALFGTDIYATIDSRLYRSPDMGDTWEKCRYSEPDKFEAKKDAEKQKINELSKAGKKLWWYYDQVVKSERIKCFTKANAGIFAGSDSGVYFSNDDGNNWSAVNNGLTNPFINALAAIGNYIFAATEDGVFVSENNGAGWQSANEGIKCRSQSWAKAITSLAVSGNDVFASTKAGIYKTSDMGNRWEQVIMRQSDTAVYALASRGNLIFAGTWYGLYSSDNNGKTWGVFGSNKVIDNDYQSDLKHQSLHVSSLAFCSDAIIVGTHKGYTISTDEGKTWLDLQEEYRPELNCGDPGSPSFIAGYLVMADAASQMSSLRSDRINQFMKEQEVKRKAEEERRANLTPEERANEDWMKNSVVCPECGGSGNINYKGGTYNKTEPVQVLDQNGNTVTTYKTTTYLTSDHSEICPYCNGSGRVAKKK